VNRIGIEAIGAYEHQLLVYGTEALSRISGLRLIGTGEREGGGALLRDGRHTSARHRNGAGPHGDRGAHGHHCAQPVMDRFQVAATTRASLAFLQHHGGAGRFGGGAAER